jgi:hypothetical protein
MDMENHPHSNDKENINTNENILNNNHNFPKSLYPNNLNQ